MIVKLGAYADYKAFILQYGATDDRKRSCTMIAVSCTYSTVMYTDAIYRGVEISLFRSYDCSSNGYTWSYAEARACG